MSHGCFLQNSLSFQLFSSKHIVLHLHEHFFKQLQEGVCTFPKISADISEIFLTKTVSDGVHDGKDEVEAVADVERNQDVVEAVPHFSSG